MFTCMDVICYGENKGNPVNCPMRFREVQAAAAVLESKSPWDAMRLTPK